MPEDFHQREFDFDMAVADAEGDAWRTTLAHTQASSAQPSAVPAGAQELPHAVRAHGAIDRLILAILPRKPAPSGAG